MAWNEIVLNKNMILIVSMPDASVEDVEDVGNRIGEFIPQQQVLVTNAVIEFTTMTSIMSTSKDGGEEDEPVPDTEVVIKSENPKTTAVYAMDLQLKQPNDIEAKLEEA